MSTRTAIPIRETSAGDERLKALVRRIEERGGTADAPTLTLHVGGAVVTGRLTTEGMWAATFQQATRLLDGRGPEAPDRRPSNPDDFIHLQDAEVTLAGATVQRRASGDVWRGRIDRVDGFFIKAPY